MIEMSRRVIFYGKAGCHLCEDAIEELRRLAVELDLAVEEIDITSDPVLLARFQYLIPVVDIEDGVLLQAPFSARQLREALAAAGPA